MFAHSKSFFLAFKDFFGRGVGGGRGGFQSFYVTFKLRSELKGSKARQEVDKIKSGFVTLDRAKQLREGKK